MILIAGTAALLNQTTSTMIGSIFQGQGREARTVARSGMSYLMGQINKEQNRHLLAVLDSQIQEGQDRTVENTLWTHSQATNYHFNPCRTFRDSAGNRINTPPRLSDINLGIGQVNNGYFYISDDGIISKNRNGATRAFRIINRDRADLKLARKNKLWLLNDEQTRGIFRLSVESAIYRNGQSNELISRTILQEDFTVIPKCCKASFGGYLDPISNQRRGHGTTNYAITDRNKLKDNICMLPGLNPDGFGIVVVVGAGGEGGFIKATSRPTIRDSSGATINPIYCISSNHSKCTSASNNSNNQMDRLDITLPPPPQYPVGFNGPPPILKSGASVKQLIQYNDDLTQPTIFNAAGITSSTQLPNNCTLDREAVHCIYSSIDTSSGDLVFISGNNTRQIRLYFPASFKQMGSGTLKHCKNRLCTPVPNEDINITDLSFFGCSLKRKDTGCGDQSIDIKGGSGVGFYIFAPEATIKLTDTPAFQGVIWAKGIDMTGTTVAPTVPIRSVADVFIVLGILPGENNTFSSSITGQPSPPTDLFAWDMKARSTSQFRFFGN